MRKNSFVAEEITFNQYLTNTYQYLHDYSQFN